MSKETTMKVLKLWIKLKYFPQKTTVLSPLSTMTLAYVVDEESNHLIISEDEVMTTIIKVV